MKNNKLLWASLGVVFVVELVIIWFGNSEARYVINMLNAGVWGYCISSVIKNRKIKKLIEENDMLVQEINDIFEKSKGEATSEGFVDLNSKLARLKGRMEVIDKMIYI